MARLRDLLPKKPPRPQRQLGIAVRRGRWVHHEKYEIDGCQRYCPSCDKVEWFTFRRRLFVRLDTCERLSVVRWRCKQGHVFRGGHWSLAELYDKDTWTQHFGVPNPDREPGAPPMIPPSRSSNASTPSKAKAPTRGVLRSSSGSRGAT